jgi:2-polyprenyl-3-methyl-5-hydroxy-6-metoxy-1,4-benzoquinol methylase
MKGDWFTRFNEGGKLYFTDESYQKAKKAFEEDLPTYLKYIRGGDSILECCCGPGYTAIPMSHHFKITAFDKDERVLDGAKENGEKYGSDITFTLADFFEINEKFGKDSFDACSSGGVLEHFRKEEILKLIDLQLKVAPIVFASMPLFTKEEAEKDLGYGISAYPYSEDDWMNMLSKHNVLEARKLDERPRWGKFRQYMVVVGR